MERKHKGAHNELVAAAWLLKQGYDVFRNVSAHGDVDIIGMKDGQLTLFDVKKVQLRLDGSPTISSLKSSQIATGVKLLCVAPDDTCSIFDSPTLQGGENAICEVCAHPFRRRSHIQRFCGQACHEAARPARRAPVSSDARREQSRTAAMVRWEVTKD